MILTRPGMSKYMDVYAAILYPWQTSLMDGLPDPVQASESFSILYPVS